MAPGDIKWTFILGAYTDSSPAIGLDGTIYIGSADNKLYAINPDGTEKWTYLTGDGITPTSPAIGPDGTIYCGSRDGKLYAINPDGTLKWSYLTNSGIYSCPAIGQDGTIYISSEDYNLYAINPDGTTKWIYAAAEFIDSSPAIGLDGTIYVGGEDYKLYAVNPDGTEKWIYSIGYYSVRSSPAVGPDNTIYVGGNDGRLHAINPDGTQKWALIITDPSDPIGTWVQSSPIIGPDGTIYVGSSYNKLYAINPNGTVKWEYSTVSSIYSPSPTIDQNGVIYVGVDDSYLYAINPDGTLKWATPLETGYSTGSSPAISQDGTIYISGGSNKLFAVEGDAPPLYYPKKYYDNEMPNNYTMRRNQDPVITATGNINFASIPYGAEIYIDNVYQNVVTNSIVEDVPVGSRQYKLKLEGWKEYTGVVLVEEDETAYVFAILIPDEGCIYFDSNPQGAKIFIDDEDTDQVTPILICDLPLGIRTYKLSLTEYMDAEGCVELLPDEGEIVFRNLTIIPTEACPKILLLLIGAALGFLAREYTSKRTTTKI